MRLVINEGHTLSAALRAVTKDADLKEAFFTTPVALRAAASEPPANKFPRYNSKGEKQGQQRERQGFSPQWATACMEDTGWQRSMFYIQFWFL